MVSIWVIAAGALAAATALILRRSRRGDGSSPSSTGAVSEEWLSQARGQTDQSW